MKKVGLYCDDESVGYLTKYAHSCGYEIVGQISDAELYNISSKQTKYDLILYRGKSLYDFMDCWTGFNNVIFDLVDYKAVPVIGRNLQEDDDIFIIPTTNLRFQFVGSESNSIGVINGALTEHEKDAAIGAALSKVAVNEFVSDMELQLLEDYEQNGDISGYTLKYYYHFCE